MSGSDINVFNPLAASNALSSVPRDRSEPTSKITAIAVATPARSVRYLGRRLIPSAAPTANAGTSGPRNRGAYSIGASTAMTTTVAVTPHATNSRVRGSGPRRSTASQRNGARKGDGRRTKSRRKRARSSAVFAATSPGCAATKDHGESERTARVREASHPGERGRVVKEKRGRVVERIAGQGEAGADATGARRGARRREGAA